MKLNQIIFGTTQMKIGNWWFTISDIDPDGGVHFEGGTWFPIDIWSTHLKDDGHIIPDSDFRFYRGEGISLL